MGYLICRVMRTYGMSYQAVMSLPIRAFWPISGFVERLHADEAKLVLEVEASAQSGEAASQMMERLNKLAPSPVKWTGQAMLRMGAERDREGLMELAALAG